MALKPLTVLRALRPKQWTKNAVVFAAFIFALGDAEQGIGWGHLWVVVNAAALFCVISSGIYLLNDVRDYEFDRAHPVKRYRPIASGELPRTTARLLAPLLIVAGLAAAVFLSTNLAKVLCAYVALQVVYTYWLKRIALVDLFVIAFGFVLRALAGAVVIQVDISPWLLLCTLLLALFLALCKRRHEKIIVEDEEQTVRENLKAYDAGLLDQLIGIMASATLVCYALYTLWPDTVAKFGTSQLGFTIPFVIFGLFRYLDLVYRHEKGGRPEQILLTDPPLIVDIALYGATVLWILLTR